MKNIFEKYNGKMGNAFPVDLKKVNAWLKTSEILAKAKGRKLRVVAIGTHESKFGESGFIIVHENNRLVGINVPRWYNETLHNMLNDTDVIESINTRNAYVTIVSRETKDGAVYPRFEWSDESVIDRAENLPF